MLSTPTPTPGAFSQMRAYSSDSKSSADGDFGFQSLGPLFPVAPAPGRYSRPKERRAEDAAAEATKEKAPEVTNQKDSVSEGPLFVSASEVGSNESVPSERKATDDHSAASGDFGMKEDSAPRNASLPTTETRAQAAEKPTSAPPRRGRERGPAKIRQVSSSLRVRRTLNGAQKSLPSSDGTQTRLAGPFATDLKADQPSKNVTAETRSDSKAWGLQEDEDTTPPATKSSSRPPARARQTKSKPAAESTADQTRITSAEAAALADSSSNRLTHVNSSGEAHMVDVGAKPHTRRVAIAVAHILVGKDLADQIEQNAMKKGDVLGVARVAGIMAAKRTADIIPLCHPLALSKAEVDVYLVPPGTKCTLWSSAGAVVAIQARVECVGPTGVEMEAMMAVQGAALTVYDMCKAVDKTLVINNSRLVYKAGGRSGVSVHTKWKRDVGEEKFGRNGELKEGVDVVFGRHFGRPPS